LQGLDEPPRGGVGRLIDLTHRTSLSPQRQRSAQPDVSSETTKSKVDLQRKLELTPRHREILNAIGVGGAPPDLLRFHGASREFDDLRHQRLIVFWPKGVPRPADAWGGTESGQWCLTLSGLAARGEPPKLRLHDE